MRFSYFSNRILYIWISLDPVELNRTNSFFHQTWFDLNLFYLFFKSELMKIDWFGLDFLPNPIPIDLGIHPPAE